MHHLYWGVAAATRYQNEPSGLALPSEAVAFSGLEQSEMPRFGKNAKK